LGGAQTDFARNWSKSSDEPLYEMLQAAVAGGLADADVSPGDVQTVHVSNVNAELFAGQAHLGGMIPPLYPVWASLPTSRHEAACASGSIAVLAAMAEIEAGRYDVALVVGVELMRNVPGDQAGRYLGSSAWLGREDFGDALTWPAVFDRIGEETGRRYSLDHAHLTWIAQNNRANARLNPLAQARDWSDNPREFADDDVVNPIVTGKTRKSDCGRITDGAAAVVLSSRDYAQAWSRSHGGRLPAVIRGWGHRTASMSLEDKLTASRGEAYLFPHVRQAVTESYRRAGLAGVTDLDVIETHDCFTVTEYMTIDHLGITPPGKAWQAIEDGRIARDGSIPVNPSGGLMANGHPVGATGIRMVNDVSRQVTDRAGPLQVDGARTAATLNVGGSATTAVSFVVTCADD
jgi:acetyl-CoA C-acetyltransferase